MNFLEEVLKKYTKITIPEQFKDISKVDSNILWYLADDMDTLVHCYKDALEIDISSAFPSICKVYIKDDNFNNTIENIKEKEGKLIYIANNLDGQQLRNLGYLSKVIIFGKIFENSNIDVDIFEIKKDSCVIRSNSDLESINGEFSKFIDNCNIKFRITKYSHYLRYKKTSYYMCNNELIVKGMYKYVPLRIRDIINKFLINNDYREVNKLNKEYSKTWLEILRRNSIKSYLELLFDCGGKYINDQFKYIGNISEIDPVAYLKIFIFPFLIARKI